MSVPLDVTVIMPSKHPDNNFYRCLFSIRAAFFRQLEYEIIVVTPRISEFSELTGMDIKIVIEDVPGIYGAMNKGLTEARGRYLYFIGQDDILLKSAVNAVKRGMDEGAGLILSDVYWGNGTIFRNYSIRYSLVWRNWCHQGIFYDRNLFIGDIGLYPVQYTIQADHYINIVFSGLPSLSITKYNGCIAWYSADGFSTLRGDDVFREAFPKIILQYFGFCSYFTVILRRFLLSFISFLRERLN